MFNIMKGSIVTYRISIARRPPEVVAFNGVLLIYSTVTPTSDMREVSKS
jgi:hypothetical protein